MTFTTTTFTTTTTRPEAVIQRSSEDIVWGVNMDAQLDGDQTATSPVTVLRSGRGTEVPLEDAPTAEGMMVRQRIRAGVLTPGTFWLYVRHTPSGTTNVLESVLKIVCPR